MDRRALECETFYGRIRGSWGRKGEREIERRRDWNADGFGPVEEAVVDSHSLVCDQATAFTRRTNGTLHGRYVPAPTVWPLQRTPCRLKSGATRPNTSTLGGAALLPSCTADDVVEEDE